MGRARNGLTAILTEVARTAARLCQARDCLIFLADGDQLRLVAKHGTVRYLRVLGETRPLNRRTPLGRAIADRRTVHVRDLAAALRQFPDTPAAQQATGVRTLVATPLIRDGTGRGLDLLVHGARPGRAASGRHPTPASLVSKRILAVDDQEDNRRILRDLLTSVGYEVIEAVTGEEAVTLAEKQRPDLILMDIQLPGIDGYEATRRIKANPTLRAIPLIVVTSYALSGDDAKAMAAGADAYVSKPFSPRALLAKVREHLG
jgi:two-component system cell cycle response regulator DivK